VAEVRHRRSKVIGVVKWFTQELDWDEAVAYCGNNQKVLALRKDFLDRRITEEKEARVKAEEATAKLESEKATIIARLAEQDRILAGGDFYVDEDTANRSSHCLDGLEIGLVKTRWRDSGMYEIVLIASTPPPFDKGGGIF
jgi:hypothetical protein